MITSLVVTLLLSGTPSARAEEPTTTADERDTDGDGVVSGKERRQARRADRRARRARNEMTQAEADAEDAADAAEASERSEAASSRASSAASAMKNMLPSADAGGGLPPGANAGPGGSGGPTAGGHSAGATGGSVSGTGASSSGGKTSGFSSGASGDPSRPKSQSDYALAAHSGYAPAFTAAGLKLAPDGRTVLRLDGRPATAEDYARLQKEISSMPAALGRRPDFFSVVSPGHYADLKRGYKDKKDGDQVYKDVGTTEGDRDFVHTASCDKLSGDCNKNIKKDSYKKGDFVAPEALDDMWAALQKELDASAAQEEIGGMPNLGAARSQVARDKAIEAARALTGESDQGEALAVSASSATAKLESTSVGQAVATARRFFKSASALAFPGADGESKDGTNPLLLIGAAGVLVLGAGVLFLRRKV